MAAPMSPAASRGPTPSYVVTGVKLDAQQRVVQVRWFLADQSADGAWKPVTPESIVDTLEVVDKLLDAEPVVPLFGSEIGPLVKVHVQDDGTELIEVDEPARHPGRTLLDLPHLAA